VFREFARVADYHRFVFSLSSSSVSVLLRDDDVFDGAEERQEKNEKQFKHAGQTVLKSSLLLVPSSFCRRRRSTRSKKDGDKTRTSHPSTRCS